MNGGFGEITKIKGHLGNVKFPSFPLIRSFKGEKGSGV